MKKKKRVSKKKKRRKKSKKKVRERGPVMSPKILTLISKQNKN